MPILPRTHNTGENAERVPLERILKVSANGVVLYIDNHGIYCIEHYDFKSSYSDFMEARRVYKNALMWKWKLWKMWGR